MNEINTDINVKFMEWDCVVYLAQYQTSNAPAILLRDSYTGEPIATASVNLDVMPKPGNVLIKVWSENSGIDDALVKAGVLGQKVAIHPAGMTYAVEYELSPQVKSLLDSRIENKLG